MINKGWGHDALLSMSVEEMAFWTAQQADYDKAVAEAIRNAAKG